MPLLTPNGFWRDTRIYERAKHRVDRVDLRRYFSEEEIASVRGVQSEYARPLPQRGG